MLFVVGAGSVILDVVDENNDDVVVVCDTDFDVDALAVNHGDKSIPPFFSLIRFSIPLMAWASPERFSLFLYIYLIYWILWGF